MQVVAHDAVIVFFVLSGYVIAYSAKEKCRSARDYAVARLSRLYSVVVPALLLTLLLWPLGRELDPELYAQYARSGTVWRYLLTLLHLNQTWLLDAYPPSNTPFWSLGYEAWYYVLFGVAWFVRPWRLRLVLVAVCALAAGPKVLLLLPAWLAGMLACFWSGRFSMERVGAVAGFAVTLVTTLAAMRWLPDWPRAPGAAPCYMSGAAISDGLTSVSWAALIWFFDCAFGRLTLPERLYGVVRWSANHTFSLYLYHAPLVIFATALIPPLGMSLAAGVTVMAVILLVVLGLGAVTEAQRPRWQWLFGAIWDGVSARHRACAVGKV